MPFVTTTPVNHTFGSSGNIPAASGAYFQLDNPGYATIGFYANPDGNGVIQYFGTFDGTNYSPLTVRQLDGDGYTFECSGSQNYIGSICGIKSMRFINTTGSTTPCSVIGVMSPTLSTLEGIENGPPPHRFGNKLIHIGFTTTGGILTDYPLYTPPPRHKFVVTDISFGISSPAATSITFHEGSGNAEVTSKWVFSTYANLPNNSADYITAGFSTPYVADDYSTTLYLTTSTSVTIRGTMHGYSAEE